MTNLNRRQWLRLSSLTGAATLLGSIPALSNNSIFEDDFKVPIQDEVIRLSSNENPYGPSKRVKEAIVNAFDKLCRYPYMYEGELIDMLSKKHGVEKDQILLTAGSNEGLRICGLTYGVNEGEIVAADPVFKALLSYAENLGAYIHRVPLTKDLGHDLEAMEKRVTYKTSLVFVCNPNNPTGTILSAQQLRDFCDATSHKTIVFSDEAYYDYIEEPNYPSMVELVKKGQNVIVSRTFSKVYGLAGIRIGYLIARPDIIARLKKNAMARPNVLATFAAIEAMKDEEFYKFSLDKNKQAKQMIYETLDDLNLHYVKSHTNFVFFHSKRDINDLRQQMLDQKVLIGRPFAPLTDWCRISTGTIEEVDMFVKGIREVLS